MIRVCIADAHAIVRRGLRQILSEAPEMVVADEARSGESLLEKVRGNACDVVLLDISMPGRGGLDVLKQLKGEHPALKVLMLSVHPEEVYAVRALRGGASGYLTKDTEPEELVAAIRVVSTGRRYISPSLAEKLADALSEDPGMQPHRSLSDREHRVMTMIGAGKAAKEIAAELRLSVKTVSTYRARVLRKMNMRNNMEIVRYALERRLVP